MTPRSRRLDDVHDGTQVQALEDLFNLYEAEEAPAADQ